MRASQLLGRATGVKRALLQLFSLALALEVFAMISPMLLSLGCRSCPGVRRSRSIADARAWLHPSTFRANRSIHDARLDADGAQCVVESAVARQPIFALDGIADAVLRDTPPRRRDVPLLLARDDLADDDERTRRGHSRWPDGEHYPRDHVHPRARSRAYRPHRKRDLRPSPLGVLHALAPCLDRRDHLGRQTRRHFLETLRGIRTIKLFNGQEERRSRWLNLLVETINRQLTTDKLRLLFRTANGLLVGLVKDSGDLAWRQQSSRRRFVGWSIIGIHRLQGSVSGSGQRINQQDCRLDDAAAARGAACRYRSCDPGDAQRRSRVRRALHSRLDRGAQYSLSLWRQ